MLELVKELVLERRARSGRAENPMEMTMLVVVIIANNKQPALVAKFGHFYSLNIQSLMCLAWPCLCASYVDVAIH